MKIKIIGALFLLPILHGCVRTNTAPSQRAVALPSGKKVNILSVTRIQFSNDVPSLMLKYQTNLKVTDKAGLRKEVDEIWQSFKGDVEKAGLTSAIISANEIPTGGGMITHNKNQNFVYKKISGKWQIVAGQK